MRVMVKLKVRGIYVIEGDRFVWLSPARASLRNYSRLRLLALGQLAQIQSYTRYPAVPT